MHTSADSPPFKKCSRCKENLSVDRFWKDKSTKSGYRSYCKDCKPDRSAYHKEWQTNKLAENPDYWREREAVRDPETRWKSNRKAALKAKYSLTPEDYEDMLVSQDGMCAICFREGFNEATDKLLAVDHDHETGKVRGLLCQTCNQAIGFLKDDVNLLQNAIHYLNKA